MMKKQEKSEENGLTNRAGFGILTKLCDRGARGGRQLEGLEKKSKKQLTNSS